MTSWNLQPWQLKASCKAINTADSTVNTDASSSYYHLNIDYNSTKEIVQLNFHPPAKQAEKEIEDTVEDKNKNNYCIKANNICNKDMFKHIPTLNDTSDKLIQVPSTSLKNNEKIKKHSRKRKSLSSVGQQRIVIDSINTNTVYDSNDLANQKDLTSIADTDTYKLDKKKKHRHRRERSQETLTITDTFSIENSKNHTKISKNEKKKHRHRRERSQTVKSENISRENCKDQTKIYKDGPRQHIHRRECSEETLTITGTFSKSNVKDQIKVSITNKEETPDNKEEAKVFCTKHKKKSKRRKDKVATDCEQQHFQDIIANFDTVSGKNAQIYYVHSTPEDHLEIPTVLRTKSKNSLVKHPIHKSKRKRKPHLSLETKCKDVQNTTSSSSEKCKSRESCASGKETLAVENKKEGIKYFFIRNKKNIKADQRKETNISKESKKGGEEVKYKCNTKEKIHSNNTHLVDENSRIEKFKSNKAIDTQQNKITISSKNKNRSQSVDANTFKKHVDRDSIETLHCVGDAGVKLNKKSKKIRCSSQEKCDGKLETSYSKRQSKNETNIKLKEIDNVMLKKSKEDLVSDQKPKKPPNKDKENKKYKKNLKVENKTSKAEVQKKNLKVEGNCVLDKIFFRKNKHTDTPTEPKSLKKSSDCTKNEKLKSENKTKTQGSTENLNITNSTDMQECEKKRENCKKRKRSKNGTETVHSVDRKSSNHKVIELTETGDGILDKKHKKSRKSERIHQKHTAAEEITPKSSEEIQKKGVENSAMESKEAHRKLRRTKEKSDKRKLKDDITKHVPTFVDINTSKSTLQTEQDQTASITDNSVIVYQVTAEKNNFVTEDPQFSDTKTENKRSKSKSKKIIKISKVQLEAIINQINKKPNLQQSKTLHYKLPSTEEKSTTELKEIRKEVSFSHLNLKPVTAYYACPTTTLNSFNGKQFDSISTYNSSLSFPSKEKKPTKPKKKSKIPDQKSVVSEAITKKEKFQYVCGRRYSTNRAARNFAYSENVFERSRKALRENEYSTVGFTVEGVEPPKMLKPNIVPNCLIKQYSNLRSVLDVALVSLVNIQPKYEEGIGCIVNHNLFSERKEVRRSLSLLNAAADGDFAESRVLSDANEKQRSSQGVPHAQTFTSLLSVPSHKSSTSHKSSSSPLESNTRGAIQQELDNDKSVKEMKSSSNTYYMQGNRDYFEEDELDKEQLAALGQEVFTRMKQYLKEQYKCSKEENRNHIQEPQSSRRSIEKPATSDQTVRSRIKKYTQGLNERLRKSSRGSSASSKKSVTKDSHMEKKDTKANLSSKNTDETNKQISLSRNSSNNSVSLRSNSPKRHLNTPVSDRSSSPSKRKDSPSKNEDSTGRKSNETKSLNYMTNDKTDRVTTASRENSIEPRKSRSLRRPTNTSLDDSLSSKRKGLISGEVAFTDRKHTESKDSIATKSNLTTSRETSNESIVSKTYSCNKHTHVPLHDGLTMQSKRKKSLSRKETSTERKSVESKHLGASIHGENEKATKIPKRVSREVNRKSLNTRLSSDKESSLERKGNYANRNIQAESNMKDRRRTSGSTSSEFSSTTKDYQNSSSRLQATKDVKSLKLKNSNDLKKVKKLKGSLQKSETFLCDSFSGEFGKELKTAETKVVNVEGNISSEDVTFLTKITEETSSQNSLDIPERLHNKVKRSHPSKDKYSKFNEKLKLINPQLIHSKSQAPEKEFGKRSTKHESTQEKKVVVDEKHSDENDEYLKHLSKEMTEKILQMLNLNNESKTKRGYFFGSNIPFSNYSGSQKIEPMQNLQNNDFVESKYLSEINILQKNILNRKPYYDDEEAEKRIIENIADKDQLIVINFSSSNIKQKKKASKDSNAKGKQEGAPEIKCSSCSIKAYQGVFDTDTESGVDRNVSTRSSSPSFKDNFNKNYNDEPKKPPNRTIQLSDSSLENAGKCKIGNCIPFGKSKIPLRREGENEKLINTNAVEKKEESKKLKTEDKSVKIKEKRERSVKREDDIEKPTQNENLSDRLIQKKEDNTKQNKHADEKIQFKKKHNQEKCYPGKCNSTDCLKMIEDNVKAKEANPTGYEQISKIDNNNSIQGNRKQKLNTGSVKDAKENLDSEEIQRLSNLVKQNVMKELKAAHLLKPGMLENNTTKEKQLDGIIERSIATALNQKVYSMMHSVEADNAVLNMTNLTQSIPETMLSSDADTKPLEEDAISLQESPDFTKLDQEKLQIVYNGVPKMFMKSNQQTAQEQKANACDIIENPHNTVIQKISNQNCNCNTRNCDCKIKECQMVIKHPQNDSDKQHKIENKKETILEKLTAIISSEPDFLCLESRLDKLLGIQCELALKTAKNSKNKAEAVNSNFENSEIVNKSDSLTVMHVQSSKNPLNYKKSNHVAYTVPARKCKVRRSRLKINSSHEINTKRKNTDITTSSTSKTHDFSKQSKTNRNAFELTTTSESSKKEIKSRSNTRSQNISKIPTLIKPTTSAPAKCVPKLTTTDTSETYSSKNKHRNSTDKSFNSAVEEANKENAPVSTADLDEPNSARFLTKLLDIELVEHPENRVHPGSSSKAPSTMSKAKTSSCINTKRERPLSAYEKRKLYGESLRLKKINSKNEPTLASSTAPEKGANEDCIYCYPQNIRGASTEFELHKQSSKEVSPSRLPPPKIYSRRDETCNLKQPEVKFPSERYDYLPHGLLGDYQDSDVDLQKLGCFLCTKLQCNPKDSMRVIEPDDDELNILPMPSKNKKVNKYPTAPIITKPSCSGRNLKQNAQRKSAPDERANWKGKEKHIYQAYSVVADHPNVTDVFRNKFKNESSISLFSKESMFSCDNILPCVSPRSFASNCSLNTFRSRTIYSTKSSSLLNTNCSDEIHNTYEETKRLNSYGRMMRGPRLRKKNGIEKDSFNMNFCSPSKEFFSTIEQNLNDSLTECKNKSQKSPLNLTSSYEFCHSTPEYVHREVESMESAEEKIPFYSRSTGISRGKVNLLEACQHLRNSSLSNQRCREYVKTHTIKKQDGTDNTSNSSNKNQFYKKNKDYTADEPLQNKYENVNRKTFFKDTKSLIYQSLERTSKTLDNSSRRSYSLPYSDLLNQQRRENAMQNLPDSNHSECDLTVPYMGLNAVKTYFEEQGHNNHSKNKNEISKINNAQNMVARVRKTATDKTVKTTKDNHNQNKNLKLHSLKDLSNNTNKSKDQHKIKPPTLKRRRSDKYKVREDDEQQATRFREGFFSKQTKRCCEDNENTLSSGKAEDESYTIFKLDNDFQIHRKRKKSLDKNQSEECFKIFAYNNVIELDMDCPSVYSTCKNSKYMNKPFLFSNVEKLKLFPQTYQYKKERLKSHRKKDKFSSTPATPTSEKTESGYGSSKSKKSKSLRKFFPEQHNMLDTFTSTFRCFDQEVCVGKSNPLSTVTTFPVNTSTYSKTCSRPQSDSCPTDYDSQPNSSRRQRRTLPRDNTPTSDCSDSPNDPYKYNQTSSSQFKNNRFIRHDRPVSYLYNTGVGRSDEYCTKQTGLDDINNYDQRGSVNFEGNIDQPSSSNKDRKPLNSNRYSNQRHEEHKTNNDDKLNFCNKRYKSRIPQKLKPRASESRNELEEQFPGVCNKHKSLLLLKQKISKSYGRKENQNYNSSNRIKVYEEQASYSNYRHTLPTPIKQTVYETQQYKEPEDYNILQHTPQRQLSNIWQMDSNESVEEAKERFKGLCSKQSDVWQSDSKEPVHRTGGRFKELIRSISRPFHISRKMDEDGSPADEQSSSYTITTKDSESNQKYFWFRNDKNRKVNSDVTSKYSETSLRDIAVGMSQTRFGETQNFKCLQKQVNECHEYVNKVCTESRLRKEGHLKQFTDFKEIPLSVLLGKKGSQTTERVTTSSNSSNKTNRSKKLLPKLKVLDDNQHSKEVLELKSLCQDGQDIISKHTFSNKLKKNYFHDESIANLGVKISKSKPFNKSKEYTKETCKALGKLLENSECTNETCKSLRIFLKKSECTKDAYNNLRNALKESECTEETCKNLRELLKELRETFLEGTEDTSVNLKNVSKESIVPLKELLDIEFQKLLNIPTEYEPSSEVSTELMRLPFDTYSSRTSSQHSIKELLELPYQESTQTTSKTLSEDSIVSLRELLDRVFEELLSTASKNSSVSSKLSTRFIKSPFEESSHASLEETSEFSPSERTVSSGFTESKNLPVIKLDKSPGKTSLNKSSQPSAMKSADITKKNQKSLSTESLEMSFKDSVVSQVEKLLNGLSQQRTEKLFESVKENSDTPLKEVHVNVLKSSPKAWLKESITELHPEYTQPTFANLRNLSKESQKLLQVTLQKVLSRSKENSKELSNEIDTLSTNISSKESSKHSVEQVQFSSSRSKAMTFKDLKKITNKSLDASSKKAQVSKSTVTTSSSKSNNEPCIQTTKTSTKGLGCLSKESKEILEDIFQKLLTLSIEPVGASLKNIITSPAEVSLENAEKYLHTGVSELSPTEHSETISNNLERFSEESDKMPTKEPLLHIVKLPTESEISLNTSAKEHSPCSSKASDESVCTKLKATSEEHFKPEPESDLSRNFSLPTEMLLKELLQYYVEVPSNSPFSHCTKCINAPNKNLNKCSKEHNAPLKEVLKEYYKPPPETLIMSITKESLPGSSKEIMKKEISLKESLEHLIEESPQHTLSCACKYLKSVLKKPLTTAPKEAIIQILKSLAENLSKESKEDLYPNIQNLFKETEMKLPTEVSLPQSIVKEPPECAKSLQNYSEKNSEEPLDLSVKEASIQICKSPESILRNTSSPGSLKDVSKSLPEKSKEMLEEVFQKLINLSEEAASSKEMLEGVLSLSEEIGVSEEVLLKEVPFKEASQDAVEELSNLPFGGCTKETCRKLRNSAKKFVGISSKEVSVQVRNSESYASLKVTSSNETVAASTILKTPSETTLKKESRHTFETPTETSPLHCTKSTCINLNKISEAFVDATTLLKTPSETTVKNESRHTFETPTETSPLQCTKSTCTNLEKVDPTTKEVSIQVKSHSDVSKESTAELNANSSQTISKNIRHLSQQSQELLEDLFQKLSTTPSKVTLEEAAVKLLNLSKEMIPSEEAAPSTEVALQETTPYTIELLPKIQHSECTDSTCKYRTHISKATSCVLSKEVSIQALESPSPASIKESIKNASDTTSASLKKLPDESKEILNVSLQISSEHSVEQSPKLPLAGKEVSVQTLESSSASKKDSFRDSTDAASMSLKTVPKELRETLKEISLKESSESSSCTKKTCTYQENISTQCDELSSKEVSVQVLESTEDITSASLKSLLTNSKEMLEEISLKESPESSIATPPNEDLSKCTDNTCKYLRNLPKESRALLENNLQDLIIVSKQSSNTSLGVLPEEPPQLTESLPEKVANKPSEDTPIESAKLSTPRCTCGHLLAKSTENVFQNFSKAPLSKQSTNPSQLVEMLPKTILKEIPECKCKEPTPKCTCNDLINFYEEPAKSLENSTGTSNKSVSVNSKKLSQFMNSLPEATPMEQKLKCSYQNLTNLPEEPKERNVITQTSSVQSKDTPQLKAKESLQPLHLDCGCKEPTPKYSSQSENNASTQAINEESKKPPQFIERMSETTPISSDENLISFSKESWELLAMTLQNSATAPQQAVSEEPKEPLQLMKSISQDADKESLLNNPTPECTCKDFTKLSQESIELSNTIFQNLVKSSEECLTLQINEQPHIIESFSETPLFKNSAKESLEFSKYFFKNLASFPKESKELLIAFQAILNTSKVPLSILAKEAPAKLNPLHTKICGQCRQSPEPDNSAEIPEELLRQLCNVSLKAMMELYDKVSDDKDMKPSFKRMVEELCKNKLKRENLSGIATQSQLNIVDLLHNYRKVDVCKCSQNKQNVPAIIKKEEIKVSPGNYTSADNMREEDKASTSTTFKAEAGVSIKSQESFTDLEFSNTYGRAEGTSKATDKKNPLKALRDSLTDKELFEKLLDSYEKEENIVERLSNDDEFFQSQLELVKSKESIESLLKSKEKIMRTSEEKLLTTMNLDSFSELTKVEEKKKSPSSVPAAKTTESLEIPQKRPSKSKISGFKSRVARLFKSDAVKEIVAPRVDGYKNSVDVSYLGRQSASNTEIDEEAEQIHKSISGDDLFSTEENQKVKFTGGRFHEEKKLLGEDSQTFLTEARKHSKERKSSIDSDSNIVKPTELGKCFLRGFRSDYVSLGGDTCLLISNQEKELQGLRGEAYIEFSERDTPLEYLLALGFSIDEASNAIKDEDVKNRLFAAITEARIWINQISTVQGTLLYLIAYKARPRIMRYYLQLVEAIINRRIQNAVKLDAFLRVLEKVEDGDLTMVNIIGSDKFDDEENEEKVVKKQLRQLFINVYKTAETEANLKNKPLSKDAIILLRILAAKYRAGLHPHLELIARYIGQGLLRNEVQLEAAMIYLSRLDTADVNLEEFEQYCGIDCKQNKSKGKQTKVKRN